MLLLQPGGGCHVRPLPHRPHLEQAQPSHRALVESAPTGKVYCTLYSTAYSCWIRISEFFSLICTYLQLSGIAFNQWVLGPTKIAGCMFSGAGPWLVIFALFYTGLQISWILTNFVRYKTGNFGWEQPAGSMSPILASAPPLAPDPSLATATKNSKAICF